jgi:imidazolonepropionase-like amidohydrolase
MKAGLMLCAMLFASAAIDARTVVIENVNVLPMDREVVLRDHAVVIADGRIVDVRPMSGFSPAADSERIDGAGGYLLPGLVDTHVHLEEYMDARPEFGDAPVFLRHGITSVFNLRGFPDHLVLRDRINAGELLAPSLYTSGEFVNEPRIRTPADAAAEVRAQAEAGYDMLKFREVVDHDVGVLTTTGVDLDTFRAVHAAAREHGLPVIGHAPHGLGLQAVLDSGHTLAHVGELVMLHFFPRTRPSGALPYGAAMLLLLAVGGGALAWRGWVGRNGAEATRLAGAAGALLALGLAALGLLLLLLPGALLFGNMPLVWLLGACFALLVLLGLLALGGGLRRRAAARTLAAAWLAVGVSAVIAGAIGLVQGVPIALRATAGAMDRVAAQLAEAGASIGTTLVIYDEVMGLGRQGHGRISPASVDPLLPAYRDRYVGARAFFADLTWRDMGLIEKLIPRYDDYTRKLTGALHRAGVPLLAGTDAYGFVLVPPGESMHAELEILVDAGLSPYHALRSATVEPARFIGREHEFGVIAPGLRADLLLLAANPLQDIRAIRDPRAVVVRGRVLSRQALDRLVDTLRAAPGAPD